MKKNSTQHPYNVCFVLPHAEPAGGERVILELAKNLNPSQFLAHVVLPHSGRLSELFEKHDIPVAVIPFKRYWMFGYPPAFSLSAMMAIGNQLKTWNIDLVHVNDSYLSVITGIPAFLTGTKSGLTAHGTWDAHFALQDVLNRVFFDRLWPSTETIRKALLKRKIVQAGQVKQVPFGVDCTRFSPSDKRLAKARWDIPADSWVATRIARYNQVKNFPLFLQLAKRLIDWSPKVHVVIAGDRLLDLMTEGQEVKAEIERLAQSPEMKGRLHTLGFVEDVPSVLQASDVFVSTSYSESFGISLLEAMACEVPVISTVSDGPQEIIEDGHNGYLVEHTEECLFEKTTFLLEHEDVRQNMGRASRQRVSRYFNQANFVELMQQQYRELLEIPSE